MKLLGVYVVCFLCLLSCKSPQAVMQDNKDLNLKAWAHDNFEITSIWANPIGNSAINALGIQGALGAEAAGSRINITGNANYVRKTGDNLEIYLPYYGTRTTGATPLMNTPNLSIRFEGVPEKYTLTRRVKKDRTQMTFDITDNNGRHSFLVKIYKDKRVTIDVNATHRSRIQYEGTISALPQ